MTHLSKLLCLLLTGLLLISCSDAGDSRRTAGDGKPVIVVSIHPLASLITPLVGDWGQVVTLLPAGVSVHGYEPDASLVRSASQADLLIVVGRNLDGWAQSATQRAAGKRKVPVITFAAMLDGKAGLNEVGHDDHDHGHHDHAHHGHDHSGPNAHLWLDPVHTRQFIASLVPTLTKLAPNPQAAEATIAAAAEIDRQLAQLDEEYKAALNPLPRKDLVTFHHAFDLLAQRYGLNVAAHLTDVDLAPGGEVTPDQLLHVIQTIRKLNLAVIYVEPQFPDRASQVITQETGVITLRVDDLGGPHLPGYETYFGMMESNLQQFIKGQSLPAPKRP